MKFIFLPDQKRSSLETAPEGKYSLLVLQRADELGELFVVQVGDRPERHAVAPPMARVESAKRLLFRPGGLIGRRPDEHVDRVLLALIHDCGDRPARDVLETA